MKKTIFAGMFLAAAFLTGSAAATPTRILTIDNGNQIVPDDWDATIYYSLSPNFKNHFYFDQYSDGSSLGWAFLDLKLATLVVWWNKPYEAGLLYDAVVSNGSALGYSSTAFATNSAHVFEAKENRIATPDTKVGLGLAVPLSEALNLAVCFRLAQLDDIAQGENFGAAGAPAVYSGNTSTASLVNDPAYYPSLGVWKYENQQASKGILISPQFSYFGSRFTLSAKFDLLWDGVDNSHSEELLGSGTQTGSVTQTLKEKGTLSWAIKPHFRYELNDSSSVVLRGSYSKLGFNSEHRIQGSFSGSFGAAKQLAGYDYVDGSQALEAVPWEAVLGLLKTWEHGRHSLVLGAGAKGETDTVLNQAYQAPASAASYDDISRVRKVDISVTKLAVPIFMGAELGLTPWAKARGMISRNFYSTDETISRDESYDSTGAITARSTTRTADDSNPDWTVAMGFGLNFGSFSWDTALNSGVLGSAKGAAFVNPLYQSSFTYAY